MLGDGTEGYRSVGEIPGMLIGAKEASALNVNRNMSRAWTLCWEPFCSSGDRGAQYPGLQRLCRGRMVLLLLVLHTIWIALHLLRSLAYKRAVPPYAYSQ